VSSTTEAPTVRLANEIAIQFHHVPRDQAVQEIATHIKSFWDPRMRTQLQAHVAAGGDGLDELVIAAADTLRS
jgi:formate dehydrogenase subunit delta